MVSNRKRSGNPPQKRIFGCEICKVKTCSEAILRQHFNGKGHTSKLLRNKKNRCHKKFAAYLLNQLKRIEGSKRKPQIQRENFNKPPKSCLANSTLVQENKPMCKIVEQQVENTLLDNNYLCSTNEENLQIVTQKNGFTKYLFGIQIFTYSSQWYPLELDKNTVLNCLNRKIGKLMAQQSQVFRKTDVKIRSDEQGQCARVRLLNTEVVAKIIKLGKSEGFYIGRRRLNIKPWYRKEKELPYRLRRAIKSFHGDKKKKKNNKLKKKVDRATNEKKRQTATSSSVYSDSASEGMLKVLSNCQSVSDQMSKLKHVQQSEVEVQTRKRIVDKLTEIFSSFFPGCSITEIGLPALGFGTKNCILDLNLNLGDNPTPADHKRFLPISSVPSDIRNKLKTKMWGKPNVTKESFVHLTPEEGIIVLYQILYGRLHAFPIFLAHTAGVPVVRFKHCGVTCRLYLNNREAETCTDILSMLTQIDDRVPPLIFTVLYWAERCKHDVFVHVPVSKYAWTMLVVFYLQNTSPRILPPVMPPGEQTHAEDWQRYHRNRLQIYKESARKSNQDLESLLKGFCEYYSEFDFAHKTVCASTGQIVNSSEMTLGDSSEDVLLISQMNVQDPFSEKNSCHDVIKDSDPARLKQNLSRVTSMLQKNVQKTPSSDQQWGLASILEDTTLPHTFHPTKPSLNVQIMTSSSQAPNVPRSTSKQTTLLDYHTSTKYCFPVCIDTHVESHVESEEMFQQMRVSTCSRVLSILKEIFYFDIEVTSVNDQMLESLEASVQGRSNIGNKDVSSRSLDGSNNTRKALGNVSPSTIHSTGTDINNNNRDVKPGLTSCKSKNVKLKLPNDESPGNEIEVRIIGTDAKPWDEKPELPSCKSEDVKPELPSYKSEDVKPESLGNKRDDAKPRLPNYNSKDVKPKFHCNKNEDSTPCFNNKKVVEPGSRGSRSPEFIMSPPHSENGNFDTSTDFKEVYIDLTNPSKYGDSLNEPSNTQTSSLPIIHSDLMLTANECQDKTEPPCKKAKLNSDFDKSCLLSLKCTTRYSVWYGRKLAWVTLRNVFIEEGGFKRSLVEDHAFPNFRLEKEISDHVIKTRKTLTHMKAEFSFVLGICIPEQNQARIDFKFSQIKNKREFRSFYNMFRKIVTKKLYKYCEIKQEKAPTRL